MAVAIAVLLAAAALFVLLHWLHTRHVDDLQQKVRQAAPLAGRSLAELIALLGPPQERCGSDGRTEYVRWKAEGAFVFDGSKYYSGYSVVLLFRDGVCQGIYSEERRDV